MKEELARILAKRTAERRHPDGSAYHSLSLTDTASLAEQLQLPAKNIEIAALQSGVLPERYTRNMTTLSVSDQIKLLQSRVCVVGLGGLGGFVTEILARIGVGALTLIDGDAFDESNLNRQLFSSETGLSRSKSETASRRVQEINSSVQVFHHARKLTPENASELLADADVAVDCLDNIATRFDLQAAANARRIPMVSAAVGGCAGQLTTIFPGDKGLELVYGPPDRLTDARGAEVKLGNVPFTVSTVAALEAAEVVNLLLNRDSNLRNRLLIVDLQDYTFERIRLA